jgi:hypothetical protein
MSCPFSVLARTRNESSIYVKTQRANDLSRLPPFSEQNKNRGNRIFVLSVPTIGTTLLFWRLALFMRGQSSPEQRQTRCCSWSHNTVLQNLPLYPAKGYSVFGSCFFQFPGLRGQFHVLLTKHASALLSTGVLGVRRTPGHPGTRPAMSGGGAELDASFAQPGFQHRPQSSTNGLARQDNQNATKEEDMTENQESDATLSSVRV